MNFLRICCLYWYMCEEDRILLSFELEKHRKNLDYSFIDCCLESKSMFLLWLLETKEWHTRDFFSNILNEKMLNLTWKTIIPVYDNQKRKVTKEVRRRGYKDKGTRRLLHENHGIRHTVLTEEEEEERKSLLSSSLEILKGFFT